MTILRLFECELLESWAVTGFLVGKHWRPSQLQLTSRLLRHSFQWLDLPPTPRHDSGWWKLMITIEMFSGSDVMLPDVLEVAHVECRARSGPGGDIWWSYLTNLVIAFTSRRGEMERGGDPSLLNLTSGTLHILCFVLLTLYWRWLSLN